MITRKLAAIAGFALILSAGSTFAADSYPSGRNTVFAPDQTYSSGANLSGGADLSVGGEVYSNTFEHGRCVQAINDNEAADVRAFCPPDKWSLVP
jgi:hypothetical protein